MYTYTPKQLAFALHKTIEKCKMDLTKPVYPEKKLEWIRRVSILLITMVENEANKFNRQNPGDPLMGKDMVSVLSTAVNLVLKAMGIKQQKE